ncbi:MULTISPECIES: metallophosphoesterase family protein [Enterococcus]|uniref:metallophosphoesterase family protein n=1 Tax=Enterococcus TaxID=1350 RepID=UPI0011066488|nr:MULTISPECIES: metallophosphoesterase family protein [Enterococcus]MDB1679839.1 metallophosphoesterase family protein [Enterococcus durans]WCG28197.1 metallophosphoesterase family protein [Enterococcus durans]WCG69759.1 metallophosphoesterase family protein [Enterococcus durans]
MAIYLTSDLHLFHKNIFGEDGFVTTRSHFKTVAEMNDFLIKQWNKQVSGEDVIYHLGDLAMDYSSEHEVFTLLKKLKGQIVLIRGNHDKQNLIDYLAEHNYSYRQQPKFIFADGLEFKYHKRTIHLTHYPMLLDSPKQFGFYGHIHQKMLPIGNILNVGIDSPELGEHSLPEKFGRPIKLDTAIQLVEEKIKKFEIPTL